MLFYFTLLRTTIVCAHQLTEPIRCSCSSSPFLFVRAFWRCIAGSGLSRDHFQLASCKIHKAQNVSLVWKHQSSLLTKGFEERVFTCNYAVSLSGMVHFISWRKLYRRCKSGFFFLPTLAMNFFVCSFFNAAEIVLILSNGLVLEHG